MCVCVCVRVRVRVRACVHCVCPWRLQQLGLRAEHRVSARPRWWPAKDDADYPLSPLPPHSLSLSVLPWLTATLHIAALSDEAKLHAGLPQQFPTAAVCQPAVVLLQGEVDGLWGMAAT